MITSRPKTFLALAGFAAGLASTACAQTTYYWDTNGTAAGFGTSPRDGTWGVDAFWGASNGITATVAWPGITRPGNPDLARFDGGGGTVTVSGTQTTGGLRIGAGGAYTLSGGTISLETGNFGTGIALATFTGDNSANSLIVDSTVSLGADGGTGTREIIFTSGRTDGAQTANANTLTINGSITGAIAGRAQLVIFRPQQFNAASGQGKVVISSSSVISNGTSTSVALELGTRSSAATSGRVEISGSHTYTGETRIGSGTIVINANAPSGSAGALGNAASALNMGFGQLVTASKAQLLTGASGVTVGRAINVANGTVGNDYGVVLGGEHTSGTSTFSGNVNLSSGAAVRTTVVQLTSASGGRVDFTGVLSHSTGGSSVPIEKIGLGIVNLSGANTYTGATTVTAGTLLVNNATGSGTGTGDVNVGAAGTLGGNGSIAGSVTFTAGASFVFSTTDALSVNGASVSFGGFGVSNLFGLTNSVADGIYTLIDGSASISSTNLANLGSGSAFDLGGGKSAYFDLGTGDLQVIVSSIPEPSTFAALAGLGGLGLATLRRRRTV